MTSHLDAHEHAAPMAAGPTGPLQGLRFIDNTHALAGPFAAMFLADLGADVIKVEPPEGDWSRALGPKYGDNTAYSVGANLGKRSIAVDLKTEAGRGIVERMLPKADVFLEGFRPGVIDRLGFSGIKLHISWNGYPYDGDRYAPVYEYADARQLPILAHCWGDESVRQFARMARKYPRTKCLVAHTGAGNANINYEEAKRTPNLFLELAFSGGTPWDVERTVREVGASRVVWGSDTALFAASHQIGKVIFADLPDADKRLILGGNAKQIFGL